MAKFGSERALLALAMLVASTSTRAHAQTMIGEERAVDEPTAVEVEGDFGAPRVTFDGTVFLAVWNDPRNAVYGARFDREGRLLDPFGIRIGDGFPWSVQRERGADVASNGDGFLVVWESENGIFARRVGSDGRLGEGVRVEGRTPRVASDGADYLIASLFAGELRAQRFGSNAPAMIAQGVASYVLGGSAGRYLAAFTREPSIDEPRELTLATLDRDGRTIVSRQVWNGVDDMFVTGDRSSFFLCARGDAGELALYLDRDGNTLTDGNFCDPMSSDGTSLHVVRRSDDAWTSATLEQRVASFVLTGKNVALTPGVRWTASASSPDGVLALGVDANGVFWQWITTDMQATDHLGRVSSCARPQLGPIASASYVAWSDGRGELRAAALGESSAELVGNGVPMAGASGAAPLFLVRQSERLSAVRIENGAMRASDLAIEPSSAATVRADEQGFLVAWGADGTLRAQRVGTGEPLLVASTDVRELASSAVGANTYVAWTSQDSRLYGVLLSADGAPRLPATAIAPSATGPLVASDGTRIALAWLAGDELVGTCLEEAHDPVRLSPSGARVVSFAFAAMHGRFLAVWAQDGADGRSLRGRYLEDECRAGEPFVVSALDHNEGSPALRVDGSGVWIAYERWVDGENSTRLRVRRLSSARVIAPSFAPLPPRAATCQIGTPGASHERAMGAALVLLAVASGRAFRQYGSGAKAQGRRLAKSAKRVRPSSASPRR